MKYVLFFLGLCAFVIFFAAGKTTHPSLIYDCFLFYNEADLLELRLEEMHPYVDRFVIVEAQETFRGNPKPLNFPALAQRLQRFSEKIVFIPLEGHFETDNPWKRERFQRDQILRGLVGCKKNDIILISDVDEIVRKEKIPEVAKELLEGKTEVVVLSQNMYFGYANRYQGKWNGPVATTYAQVKRLTPRIIRKLRHMKPRRLRTSHISKVLCIQDAGWHFSSLGGPALYLDKIHAFSHSELDTEEFTKQEHLIRLLKSCPLVPLDSTFPLFLRQQQAHFLRIGFLDTLISTH